MKQLLLFILLMLSVGLAFGQSAEPNPIRIYRVSDNMVIADSAGNNLSAYPYGSVFVRAYNALIEVNANNTKKYYTPTRFRNESGTPYSTISANAALNNFLLSVPTYTFGGLSGTVVATTNAGALTSGQLDNARLSPDVVLANLAQSLLNKTLVSPVISNPTGLVKADVGLNNVDNTADASKPVSGPTQTALNGKEATLPTGTSGQVILGNKTLGTLNKALVGLSNVDNTTDANKPVSTAQAQAIALKAPLASPTFTGIPSGPTAATTATGNQFATLDFVKGVVANSSSSPNGGTTVTRQTITSGTASTIANATGSIDYYIDPSTTLPTHTTTFPATPVDNQRVTFHFGGTITTGTVINTFSVLSNTGQTVIQASSPGTVLAGEALSYVYNSSNSKWYRSY